MSDRDLPDAIRVHHPRFSAFYERLAPDALSVR